MISGSPSAISEAPRSSGGALNSGAPTANEVLAAETDPPSLGADAPGPLGRDGLGFSMPAAPSSSTCGASYGPTTVLARREACGRGCVSERSWLADAEVRGEEAPLT